MPHSGRSGRATGPQRGYRAGDQQDATGPPWETGSWDSEDGGWNADAASTELHGTGLRAAVRDTGGQPALTDGGYRAPGEPGLSGYDHPSGPLPPLPAADESWDDYAPGFPGSQAPGTGAGGLPSRRSTWRQGAGENTDGGPVTGPGATTSPGGDYPPGGGFPAGSAPGYGGSYQPAPGYPDSGGYPSSPGYADTGGFPSSPGYPDSGGYPSSPGYADTGGFPSSPGYPDSGGYPSSPGYADTGGFPAAPGYAARAGYLPAAPYGYPPGQDEQDTGRGGRRRPGAGGYPEPGGWNREMDDRQAYTDSEQDDGLLPGMGGNRSTRGHKNGRPGATARKRKRKGHIALYISLAVILAIVGTVGGYGYKIYMGRYHPADYSGPGTGSVTVHIRTGDTAATIGQILQDDGVVASARAFSNAAAASPKGNALEPGYFRLHEHMSAALAFALLLKPSTRVQLKAVIPEGLRESEILATLGKDFGNAAGYQQAAANPSALGLPSYAKGKLEGYLFPATYTFPPGTSPVTVLRAMVQRFGQEASSVSLPAAAKHAELSQGDVITVASLIQAEGKRPQDFPKIARVIYNRLNNGIPLELDTTVLYAMHSRAGDVTIAQTKYKSLYNTYLHSGLPPGPIDSPGDAAIRAALHPAPSSDHWLYFLTVNPNTGLTKFTSDYNTFLQFQTELAKNKG